MLFGISVLDITLGGRKMDEPNLHAKSAEFLLAEYGKLRDEILEAIKEIRAIERYFVLAAGALMGWAFSSAVVVRPEFFAVPFLMAVLSGMRAHALHRHIGFLGGYLKSVEAAFASSDLGWERHLAALDARGLTLGRSELIFWVAALVVTGFIAVKYGVMA